MVSMLSHSNNSAVRAASPLDPEASMSVVTLRCHRRSGTLSLCCRSSCNAKQPHMSPGRNVVVTW